MKRYPLSLRDVHSIELVRNGAYLADNLELSDRALKVLSVIQGTSDGKVAWLTGEELLEARELTDMGGVVREGLNSRSDADRVQGR